jgi:hypothetical protein
VKTIKPVEAYIKETGTAKGRGVFAAREFKKGEVVEVAPVIVMHRPFEVVPPVLKTVVFNWTNLAGFPQPAFAIALGYGSMYNHDNPANMIYKADSEAKTIHYIAVTDITKDEELTINYNSGGGSAVSDSDDWFQKRGITPV